MHRDKNGKIRNPSTTLYVPEFELVQNFARARMADSDCIMKVGTPLVTKDLEVIGGVIFEQSDHSELTLNWYFANLKSKGEKCRYSQSPLNQSWIVDYPMLAYKSMLPTNREIALVHLAQEIPQRIINLGEYEFICFVH